MRKFIIIIFVILLFLSGCQVPVDNITDGDQEFENTRTEDEILDTYDSSYSKLEGLNDEQEDANKEIDDEERDDEEIDNKEVGNKGIDNGEIGDKKISNKEINKNEYVEITAYYRDIDDMVVPVTRKIKRQEGIARAVIESMIKNEANTNFLQPYKLFTLLPEGTVILGMNIKDGTVFVDFNKRFLNYENEIQEINIISSIVYSLTEFGSIDDVKILVDGREQDRLEYGTDISGYLNRRNVLINSKKLNIEEKVKKLDVYLYKNVGEEFNYLLPISFEYIGIEDEKISNEIVRLLGKNYESKKLFSQLPLDVNLLDSKLEGDTLILNFSDTIRNYGGTAREEGILNQIFNSMKQIEGVEKIKILIEGKEGELPEGTDISKDIYIQNKINIV